MRVKKPVLMLACAGGMIISTAIIVAAEGDFWKIVMSLLLASLSYCLSSLQSDSSW